MNHSNPPCLSGKTFLLCVPCVNFVSLVVIFFLRASLSLGVFVAKKS